MIDLDPFTDLLDYPMYVVTAEAHGEKAGCLVGFASQCSIRPARFMIWLSKANRTCRVAEHAERLVIHLLRRDQDRLAQLFGGDHVGFLLAPEAAESLMGNRTPLLTLNDTHDITPGHPAN
ncbi:flavin reductase [Streptomyces olivochromogenes]|uniref:Oxidoreductase n=1 Tax=Streptomyces olivochromogenes TaxID=1963 RepID=A0A250VVK8_STROL|nr:flavin reductase [Streptomyces olivochromogenes]KUN42441.1 flavin oxidoreductase [Streptomyces olivochromogenes]GAX57990.1 oxidoreductase [Streptomyces olivochromogenes]